MILHILMSVACIMLNNTTLNSAAPQPVRQAEYLDRGLVALPMGDGCVYLGWRMLGTEPDNVAYNVYRRKYGNVMSLNKTPLKTSSNYIDRGVSGRITYMVRPVIDGVEGDAAEVTINTDAVFPGYVSIPLQTPAGYQPNDSSVGDLDGDGQYELVLMQCGRSRDNSQAGVTDPPILQAYTLEGKLLWQINLGINIRSGAHYTQFQVFDYDGDGRAELICKTADGTVDGVGRVIGDAKADHRNEHGYILRGPEYLTVFDGRTGAAIDTTQYWPQRIPGEDNPTAQKMKKFWGDGYGNRLDRFLAGTAYLDGCHPSVIFSRGYYTRTFIAAYDFRDGKLVQRWTFDSEDPQCVGDSPRATDGRSYTSPVYSSQGFHSLSVADVDNDGRDEIVFGAMVVDDDGRGLFSTGLGHGDAMHVGDLDPNRPGLEVFGIQERFDDAGAYMYAADTGKILWKKPSVKASESGSDHGEGPGRGVCFNVDPRYPGNESWTAGAGISGVWDAKGNPIGDVKPGSVNFAIYWDGDLLRELLDGNFIDKWNWESQQTVRLLTAEGCRSNNGTKATPALSADLLGDWREEVILPTEDNRELRLFTTTILTSNRLRTLMHDPQYRLAIASQNTAYNQPPHTSFYIDPQMPTPAKPKIKTVRKNETGKDVLLLPYFRGNGETGVYLAWSLDGLTFRNLADGKPVLPAPDWPNENLTRDPSLLYHEGVFHMVWTTSWNSLTIGYASSPDLIHWSKPKRIKIWKERTDVKNTWAPELHWDPERREFLILWSSTTIAELEDNDGTGNPHNLDHRSYASRTKDFKMFTKPELFYSTKDPELSVIDPYIAFDPGKPWDKSDDRWVMVIKNEMYDRDGGKNLCLTFAPHMQGPYEPRLGKPIVGAGTNIENRMAEGPSLLQREGIWWLYWDAPGSRHSYCLATSPDLVHWTNRTKELSMPVPHLRHGTVCMAPSVAVERIIESVPPKGEK